MRPPQRFNPHSISYSTPFSKFSSPSRLELRLVITFLNIPTFLSLSHHFHISTLQRLFVSPQLPPILLNSNPESRFNNQTQMYAYV